MQKIFPPLRKIFFLFILTTAFSYTLCFCVAHAAAQPHVASITPQAFDAAKYFEGMQGTVVLYTPQTASLKVYNEKLATQAFSPFSTFKIVSTLLGLEQGLLVSKNSKMQYNGKKYWLDAWNKDVTLQEAFQFSCVWYYHQLIYALTPDIVAKFLKKLHYGNEDISQWQGNGRDAMPDLNGFWLDSSLKISPLTQVQVVADIFEGHTDIASEHVALVKEIMLLEEKTASQQNIIYAKTGANGQGKSWLVGFVEAKLNRQRTYFAFFVNDPRSDVRRARQVGLTFLKEQF